MSVAKGGQGSIFLSSVRKARQSLSARWVLFDGMVTTSLMECNTWQRVQGSQIVIKIPQKRAVTEKLLL